MSNTFRTIINEDDEILFEIEQLFDAYDGSMLGYYVEFHLQDDRGYLREVLRDPEGGGTMVFSSPYEARNFAPQLISEQIGLPGAEVTDE
ncbi:MAG: hypothetical protein AAF532_04465 [Planctomycetota bacterium]